jgi:dCTP deaminase
MVRSNGSGKVISYGLSSYGYDVRLANKFKIFTNIKNALIDPLEMSDDCYIDHEGDHCIIPPNSYILGHTVETFDIPRDVMVICVGKSTYARCAAIVNVTPIEPGFKGQVVIEISNASPLPLKVYAGQGIAQFMFLQGGEPCQVSYADRRGKYQGQTGVTTARL